MERTADGEGLLLGAAGAAENPAPDRQAGDGGERKRKDGQDDPDVPAHAAVLSNFAAPANFAGPDWGSPRRLRRAILTAHGQSKHSLGGRSPGRSR
jgi:hypothetical protein